MNTSGARTDGQTDGQSDGRTDRRSDGSITRSRAAFACLPAAIKAIEERQKAEAQKAEKRQQAAEKKAAQTAKDKYGKLTKEDHKLSHIKRHLPDEAVTTSAITHCCSDDDHGLWVHRTCSIVLEHVLCTKEHVPWSIEPIKHVSWLI